ncbi:MAG: GGDEF domain-containing protein [Candidatus Omnitrophica bacterium]|nr:GGDEF domain-containing protein [Candidatus Omnitrophota bacterium]
MLKRIVGFGIFLALLMTSGALSAVRTFNFPLHFAILSVFLFYFYFQEDLVSLFLAAVLLIIVLMLKIFLTGDVSYLWMIVILGFVGFYCAYDYLIWMTQVKLSLEKRDRSADDIQKLKERFESKEESVRRLEQQVMDIVRLFEIAKEFNECLAYKELVEVLIQKVLPEVPFARATLILLDDEHAGTTAFQIGNHVQGVHVIEEIVENSLEARIIAQLLKIPKPARWDALEHLPKEVELNSDSEFPFWIFPLFVEDKIIAVFVIENANPDDYPKFEIVSAQLAMQVKKIKLYETVKELSIIDGLTQVFVRRHFLERFSEELKRSIKHHFNLCVLMLDIDHFKTYNDTYGHLVGDMTLREVASLIKEAVRRVDIIARYGGEEFVIVLPETSKKAGLEVAERIRSTVAKKKFRVYDEETHVTVSIGISSFPEELSKEPSQDAIQMEMLELLTRADQALYKAKEEGRNRVVVFSG